MFVDYQQLIYYHFIIYKINFLKVITSVNNNNNNL